MSFLMMWLVLSAAVWATTYLVPGFKVRGFGDAVVVAAVFAVLRFFIGWFFTVVVVVGTLGIGWFFPLITHWIANAIVLQITQGVTSRVKISSFTSALAASGIISLVSGLLAWVLVQR